MHIFSTATVFIISFPSPSGAIISVSTELAGSGVQGLTTHLCYNLHNMMIGRTKIGVSHRKIGEG